MRKGQLMGACYMNRPINGPLPLLHLTILYIMSLQCSAIVTVNELSD